MVREAEREREREREKREREREREEGERAYLISLSLASIFFRIRSMLPSICTDSRCEKHKCYLMINESISILYYLKVVMNQINTYNI